MSGKTLERWASRARQGQLAELGERRRPVTELSRLKRELVEVRMERDILKKPPRTLRGRSCPVRAHEGAASALPAESLVSRAGGVPKRLLCLAASAVVDTRPGECAARSRDPSGPCAHPADVWPGAPPGGIMCRRLPRRDWAHHRRYATREQARPEITEYIELFYNRHRRDSRLGNCSPAAFAQQ